MCDRGNRTKGQGYLGYLLIFKQNINCQEIMDWICVGFKLDRFQQRKIRRYVISGKTFNDIEFVLLQFNSELS